MADAIRIVNANSSKVSATLRAVGDVDGRFRRPSGGAGHYHVDATLFYRAQLYVRFDLKSFGARKFLLGSNREYYWYHDAENDQFRCARHDEDAEASEIPIPPAQIPDALGLTPILEDSSAPQRMYQVQRVDDRHQQILFLELDGQGKVALTREYWLDRFGPRLIRRVVFRDADGLIEMQSSLDAYKVAWPGGPFLPHVITMDWPKEDLQMRFRVGKWGAIEEIGPESVQFATPADCVTRPVQ